MPNPFRKLVSDQVRLFETFRRVHASGHTMKRQDLDNAPVALIFSPHPDDECITGALPLRLLRQAKWKIVNVAVTLGSKRERQLARLKEVKSACDFLGFYLLTAGMERIDLETRNSDRKRWAIAVKTISEILAEYRPKAIFLPHQDDGHSTHIGTHFLVLEALKKTPDKYGCFVVETEYWGQLKNPNLLVESDADDVATLAAALSLHDGETRRNPYHARLPAWMIDNVRRGAELVGRHGDTAPDFIFGTIYCLRRWRNRKIQSISTDANRFLNSEDNPLKLFR